MLEVNSHITVATPCEQTGSLLNGGTGRILIVDDNESNRDVLSRRLRRYGYAVDVAVNGREALEVIETCPYDLVLLDIMMPELNGYEVLERLKADDQHQHIPVLMISAVDEIESVVRCIELGADDYLPKPFNPTLLRARVQSSLARKRIYDAERLYAENLARELEIGREIQRGFLPSVLPQPDGWEIAARFEPAQQVAGDFYDVFEMPGNRIGVVVADVCGKGVGAALFMALFRSLLRAYAQRAGVSPTSPAMGILIEAFNATNGYIRSVHRSAHTFASIFFGILETSTGRLHYVNAGHLPPIVIGSNIELRRLSPTGPAVGLMSDAPFDVRETRLRQGEMLLGFTDGVTEARDGEGVFFDEARLLDLLSSPAATAADLLERIEISVSSFAGEASPHDDFTLLAVRRAGDRVSAGV